MGSKPSQPAGGADLPSAIMCYTMKRGRPGSIIIFPIEAPEGGRPIYRIAEMSVPIADSLFPTKGAEVVGDL